MKIKANSIINVNLKGKIIVIKDGWLKGGYDTFENYFYRATGGFGCSPGSFGCAVFTENMFNPNDKERWERSDFAGWLTEEEFDAVVTKHRSMIA